MMKGMSVQFGASNTEEGDSNNSNNNKEKKKKRRSNRRSKQLNCSGVCHSSLNGVNEEASVCSSIGNTGNEASSSLGLNGDLLNDQGLARASDVAFNSLPTIHSNDQVVGFRSVPPQVPLENVHSSPPQILCEETNEPLRNEDFVSPCKNVTPPGNQRSYFVPHLSEQAVNEAVEKGEVFITPFRVNAYNPAEAYCTVSGVPIDILINGFTFQNRARTGGESDGEAPSSSSLLSKRGSSSQSAGDQGRAKVSSKRAKKGSFELRDVVLPVTKKRPTPKSVGPPAPVMASSPSARAASFSLATVFPAGEDVRGSIGDAPVSFTADHTTKFGEPSIAADVAVATTAADPAPVEVEISAEPGTSGEGLVTDPIVRQAFSRIASEDSDCGDKDFLLSMSKFASPDFPPVRDIRPNDAALTLGEHLAMIDIDRNRQHGLVATANAQGLLINNLKKKLKLHVQEQASTRRDLEAQLAGAVVELAGTKARLAKADEKVIALDCQLGATSREKDQANVELLQALSLVSKRDLDIGEVRTSYNEILPAKLSLESRVLELEEELRREKFICQATVTAICKAYAIQFSEENGLPPPEFEDEESDEFGLESDQDEEDPMGKDVTAAEDGADAPNPDDGSAI